MLTKWPWDNPFLSALKNPNNIKNTLDFYPEAVKKILESEKTTHLSQNHFFHTFFQNPDNQNKAQLIIKKWPKSTEFSEIFNARLEVTNFVSKVDEEIFSLLLNSSDTVQDFIKIAENVNFWNFIISYKKKTKILLHHFTISEILTLFANPSYLDPIKRIKENTLGDFLKIFNSLPEYLKTIKQPKFSSLLTSFYDDSIGQTLVHFFNTWENISYFLSHPSQALRNLEAKKTKNTLLILNFCQWNITKLVEIFGNTEFITQLHTTDYRYLEKILQLKWTVGEFIELYKDPKMQKFSLDYKDHIWEKISQLSQVIELSKSLYHNTI